MPEGESDYDKENVNLWVDPERKDRWQAFLEEDSEFQYLSQLIRQAVEREIQQSQNGDDSVELSESVVNNFDDLRGSINQLEQVMQEVEKRLTGLEREVRDDPEVRDLANNIFELLPTKDEINEYQSIVRRTGSRPPDNTEPRIKSGLVPDIAAEVETTEHRARQALDRLQQDTHQVHSMQRDGETRYYKEG